MVVNMIDPLMAMNLIQNYMKLKVNIILSTYTRHFSIIHIILVPSNLCSSYNVFQTVTQLDKNSGYVFCTGDNKGIQQLCPPGTEVTFQDGGCVNKTSK